MTGHILAGNRLSQFSRYRVNMNLRYLKFCLALMCISRAAYAAGNNAWDCEQTKNGEWICQNQSSGQPVVKPVIVAPQSPQKELQTQVIDNANQTITVQSVMPSAAPLQQSVQLPTLVESPKPVELNKSGESDKPAGIDSTVEVPIVQPPKRRVNVTQNQKPQLQKVEPIREPVNTSNKQSGWSCQSGGGNQNWNCNLAGPDPKGEAQIVTDNQTNWRLLDPAFTPSQELTFQMLRGEYKQDPWLNCANWAVKRPRLKPTSKSDRDSELTDVTADFSEAFEGEVLNFAGNVDLTRGDQHLLAEKASYDTGADTMDAQGNVIYSEGSLAMAADTAMMSLSTSEARLRRAEFIAGDGPLRGSAAAIYRDNEYLSRFNDTVFTSCPPGNQDWAMHAARLKINRESGQGAAKDLWMEYKGVPILYTPYISFPTDNRRLSGFLSPTWGSTQRAGFYASAPFYWNIAPNVDSTITPRYFSGRGEMLSNNLRYLTESSKGNFGFEYMPNDQTLNKPRYSFTLKDVSTIMPKMNSDVNLNLVSDTTYFTDLNTALGFNRSSYLPSTATLNYGGSDAKFIASIQHYQSVDPTVLSTAMPYDVLPRLSLNLNHTFDGMPLKVQMDNQFTDFHHNVLVNGQRLALQPSVSMPFESTAGFFTPKISVQSVQYQLSNQAVAGQPASINRTLPIMSLDSGLSFEKAMDFDGSEYTNIIEPRLFYLYIPRKNQNDIPVFDTSAYDINFNSLFRENSYSGYDRLQDANQLTLAATTRYIDNTTGLEPVKASLGQIIYFQDRTVTLPLPGTPQQSIDSANYIPVQTSKTSNIISEVTGQINQNLSYSTGAQWNVASNSLARGQAVLKFRNQPNQLFDIGYRYRSATANPLVPASLVPGTSGTTALPAAISLTDVSFRWPLFDQWYAMGRWQYSLDFDKTMESFIGLEKESCCWRFRIIGRRFINGATTNSYVPSNVAPQTAFFVELDLKGLSGIGDDVDYFLQTALNGYRATGSY